MPWGYPWPGANCGCCTGGGNAGTGTGTIPDVFVMLGNSSPGAPTATAEGYRIFEDSWETQTSGPVSGDVFGSFVFPEIGTATGGSIHCVSNTVGNRSYNPDADGGVWVTKTAGGAGTHLLTNCAGASLSSVGSAGIDVGICAGSGTVAHGQKASSYDASTDTWTAETTMPAPGRGDNRAFTQISDLFYSIGGVSLTSPFPLLRDNDEYSYSTLTWTGRADLPLPARRPGVCGSRRGLGYSIMSLFGLDVDEYDRLTNVWTSLTNFPGTDVSGPGGASEQDAFYLSGGFSGVTSYSQFYEFGLGTADTWTALTSMLTTRHRHGSGGLTGT